MQASERKRLVALLRSLPDNAKRKVAVYVHAILSQANLRSVDAMSDKKWPKQRQVGDFYHDKSDSNYYVNLDRLPGVDNDKNSDKFQQVTAPSVSGQQTSEVPGLRQSGVNVAESRGMQPKSGRNAVDMIANAGELNSPDDDQIPNTYQFEIIRLRRRLDELECIVRDRDSRVASAIAMLEDELVMYRTLMHDHIAETHDGVTRRVLRIQSTLDTLREKGSKFYPPLEMPDRWRKKE